MEDIGLYVGYGLFSVAIIAAVILPLINALKSPKELVKSGMGIGALLVVFLISFGLAGSEVTAKYTAQGIGESSSKLIGAGLTMFYIVFAAALVGIVFSEISKALK
ncbi:MAG: hypothetical protein KDC93_03165 [Cyclobacteriaceae bacterium]|jgi:hypothetical protein|nr:hypothetical protein [Cyclobacteriaceae bacterium]